MFQSIIQFFSQFPPEIATVLMAMTPVGELRLSLPVAVLGYHLPVWEAYLLAVFGNAIPAFIIAAFAGKFHAWVVRRAGRWGKDWADYLASVQKKIYRSLREIRPVGVGYIYRRSASHDGRVVGGGRGFYFWHPVQKSWPYILLGIAISGLLTLLLTVGADKIFGPKLGMTLDRLINLQQKISETTKLLKLDELKEKNGRAARTDDRAGFLV